MKNPFLSKKTVPDLVTCEDCGLDFEGPVESGRSPWSSRDGSGS